MKHTIVRYTALFAIAGLLAGCAKDKPGPDGPPGPSDPGSRTRVAEYIEKDSRNVYYVTDLPGDANSGGGSTIYFSLSENRIKDASVKLTEGWDVCFSDIYNSFVRANNAAKSDPPGAEGKGTAELIVVKQRFDEVKTAPSDEAFAASESYAAWDGNPATHTGWYTYDMGTHVMKQITGRTIVVKLANGKFAKMEMISVYKGNPENPTRTTPAPFLTFRYWIQEDGSRNLEIK